MRMPPLLPHVTTSQNQTRSVPDFFLEVCTILTTFVARTWRACESGRLFCKLANMDDEAETIRIFRMVHFHYFSCGQRLLDPSAAGGSVRQASASSHEMRMRTLPPTSSPSFASTAGSVLARTVCVTGASLTTHLLLLRLYHAIVIQCKDETPHWQSVLEPRRQ